MPSIYLCLLQNSLAMANLNLYFNMYTIYFNILNIEMKIEL